MKTNIHERRQAMKNYRKIKKGFTPIRFQSRLEFSPLNDRELKTCGEI
jgi:hypothetical protein